MNPLMEALLKNGPVLLDGAWGTQLQGKGLSSGECPDAWNLTHPEKVLEVAQSYVAAGSHAILTNTFGANSIRLAEFGLAGQVQDINRQGVEISRKAAAGKAKVFASMGPCGKMLLTGEVTEEGLRDAFQAQAEALQQAGADALVVETMADLAEAAIAVSAARATSLPVVACMVFDSGKDKDRTMMGVTPEKAAAELIAAGADIVGANCGQGIAGYVPICRRLRAASGRPVWIKANAGLPELEGGQIIYRTTARDFAGYLSTLLQEGAGFIGGCCGTDPDFIRELCAELNKTGAKIP